jgi:hypothetical protein
MKTDLCDSSEVALSDLKLHLRRLDDLAPELRFGKYDVRCVLPEEFLNPHTFMRVARKSSVIWRSRGADLNSPNAAGITCSSVSPTAAQYKPLAIDRLCAYAPLSFDG